MTPSADLVGRYDDDLNQALERLRWVRAGRDYDPRLVDDVKTVLAHFGLEQW